MLVEPPGADVPAGAGLTLPVSTTIRLGAGAAALLLAVVSRGDVLVLAALLSVVAWRPQAAAALVPALVASGWRWGSTSLEAIAGAQAVLGPAGTVGSLATAASAWLGAAALVLVTPDLRGSGDGGWWDRPGRAQRAGWTSSARPAPPVAQLLAAGAAGTAAAVVVAGPASGGALWARVAASVVATVAALAVAGLRRTGRSVRGRPVGTALDAVAIAAGLVAVLLVATDAPPWAGTVDAGAAGTGVAVAAAAAALLGVALATLPALRDLRQRSVGSPG